MGTATVGVRTVVTGTTAGFGIGERATLMRNSQLFAGLSLSECTQIAEFARPRVFPRNEVLFTQGQPFRSLVLVESGYVKLTRVSAQGSEVILALRGTRDAVELPAGTPFCNHACSARVVATCTTLTWNSSTVEYLITRMPRLSGNICCILTKQMHELQERYHEVSAEKVERRLACALIRMTEQFGTRTTGGVELSISRQELAQMTGTTLFTVSRLISKWGELGLVQPRREAVLMIDPEGLDLLSSTEQESLSRRVC